MFQCQSKTSWGSGFLLDEKKTLIMQIHIELLHAALGKHDASWKKTIYARPLLKLMKSRERGMKAKTSIWQGWKCSTNRNAATLLIYHNFLMKMLLLMPPPTTMVQCKRASIFHRELVKILVEKVYREAEECKILMFHVVSLSSMLRYSCMSSSKKGHHMYESSLLTSAIKKTS